MKQIFFFAAMLAACSLCAQTYIVHGTVLDDASGSGLEMATVCLYSYQGKDSTMLQGVQTGSDGTFFIDKVTPGSYKVEVSMVGYLSHLLPVTVKDANVQLKTVRLREDVQMLSVLDVKGQAAEMTVKGDTIEYNTAAYKVNENAMVEDLLKKMNGVEVDKEGNVTVNGEEIKSVRIDGKKFFGDDVQSATKNIPADMIKSIQVIDEKSTMAKLTGFEDDETERIINLRLKDDRKKGVFGNYNAGLGADMVTNNGHWFGYDKHFFADDFRYKAGVFTNILLGESQTTIIANANNINEIRTGRGRGGWGGNNTGITWAENLGVNTNIDLNKNLKKKDNTTSLLFGGDVAFNHSDNDTRAQSNKESYSNGVTYVNNDSSSRQNTAYSVNARFELEYQIDTLNKIVLQPNISYTKNLGDSHSEYTYLHAADSSLINDGYQNQLSDKDDISARIRLIYNHKFLKPGRSVTLNATTNLTNSVGNTSTYAFDNLGDTAKVNQHTVSKSNAWSVNLRTSWVEPIAGLNHFLETSVMLAANLRSSNKDQEDYSAQDSAYIYNVDYSNHLVNQFFEEALGLNYRYIKESVDLTVGAQFTPSQTHTKTYYGGLLQRDTTIYAWNWSPNMRFRYNFGKKEFARINYRGQSSQPSINQMEPVRNNSNAMNETIGNLALRPAFAHNVHAMYSKFNQEKFWSIMTGVHATFTQDALINNSIYDETGKLYQQTVNAQQIPWNLSGDFMFNTPFANKLMQFHTRTSLSYNQRIAYISHEGQSAQIAEWIEQGTFQLGDLSKTGNLRASEALEFRLTHDVIDIGARGQFTYSRTQNTMRAESTSNVFDWTITGDMELHLPKAWNISVDCGYTARYGYNLSDVNEVLMNATIDKTWGGATLSLQAFDILHQKKNIVQMVGENYVQYQKSNALPTYFLLTFTYKFNKMGDMKAKGMGGFMQSMIENGGKPGSMPPMGPPPFH